METDVLIIGAGQCGVSLSRELRRRGTPHEVLEARAAPGDAWRERWDSLRLFTPARFDGLPGLPFPAPPRSRPTAAEFAAYLDGYVEHFDVPLHPHTRVTRLAARPGGGFVAVCDGTTWEARRVVVATGGEASARLPPQAAGLDRAIVQRHSSQYRRPSDLLGARVLVVGCGTSGVQLGLELAAAGRHVTVAGTPTAQVPRALLAVAGGAWFALLHRVLTRATPLGRRAAPRATASGAPLVGISPRSLDRAGVERGPRLTDVVDGMPCLADGRVLTVDAVLWATGYRSAFDWIDGLTVNDAGLPEHVRGVSTTIDGLAFLGLPFQYGLTSTLIGGAGRDAAFLAAALSA